MNELNKINSKEIGEQEWMIENLNVDQFRNGNHIPEAKTDEDWENAGIKGKPAWCYYNKDAENGQKYGKLYNWYAVNDPRGLAPNGWHIPSYEEWAQIIICLGGKESKDIFFNKENVFATLLSGCRFDNGLFNSIDYFCFWWSSSECSCGIDAWYLLITFHGDYYFNSKYTKASGFSVRCIKDKI